MMVPLFPKAYYAFSRLVFSLISEPISTEKTLCSTNLVKVSFGYTFDPFVEEPPSPPSTRVYVFFIDIPLVGESLITLTY